MNNEILGRTLCLFILLCIRFGGHYFLFLSVFSPLYSLFLFFNFHVPFNININVLWMGVCCDNANSKEKLKNRVYVLFLSCVLENLSVILCEWVNKGARWERKKKQQLQIVGVVISLCNWELFFILSVFFSYRTNGVGLVWFETCTRFYISFPHECLFAFFLLNNICWIFLRFFLAVVCASIRLAFSSFHSGMLYTSTPTQSKIEGNKIKWMNEVRTKENPETHK